MQPNALSALLAVAFQPLLGSCGPLMIKGRDQPSFPAANGTFVSPTGTVSGSVSAGTGTRKMGTATGTGPMVTSTAKSSNASDPPVWNLHNSTCDTFNYLNGQQQWAVVGGDQVMANLTEVYNDNLLICPDCFGQPKGQCKSQNPECMNGLRDLAKPVDSDSPRFDNAAARFAHNSDETDLNCEIQTGECSGAPSCNDCNGPGTFAILKSMETMSNALKNVYDALGQATTLATTQMTQFSNTFAPVPQNNDVFLQIFESIVSGLVGFIPGVGGEVASMLDTVGQGVASDLMSSSSGGPADTATWLGYIANSTQQGYVKVSQSLFETGSYNYTTKGGQSKTITLADLMKKGQLMQEPANKTQLYGALVPKYGRLLFQQLAMTTWQNLQQDSRNHIPYIAFDGKPCDQVNPKDKTMVINSILKGAQKLDSNVTYNGYCYYLLDAKPKYSETGGSIGLHPLDKCEAVNALPGGTNKAMSDNSQIFSGLSLADFIIPAVEGWTANGKANGYPQASANGKLTTDPQDPGMVVIPVCDYYKDKNNGGVGCPNLSHKPEKGDKGNSCVTT